MNISEAAHRTGLPPKTIRYYEEIALVVPVRERNGYRDFTDDDVHRLHFLKRARDLGFSIGDCRRLLGLYSDGNRSAADVKALAGKHLDEIDAKIAQLEDMRQTLDRLVRSCEGGDRPSCPILDSLSGDIAHNP